MPDIKTGGTPQTAKQQVRVTHRELATPTLDDPTKITMQIQYQIGMLPPRFLYINKKDWTKEKEAEMIRADLRTTLSPPGEIISI